MRYKIKLIPANVGERQHLVYTTKVDKGVTTTEVIGSLYTEVRVELKANQTLIKVTSEGYPGSNFCPVTGLTEVDIKTAYENRFVPDAKFNNMIISNYYNGYIGMETVMYAVIIEFYE